MFLPTTKEDLKKRGWDSCDVVIITPDAYVDHPSFAMAILGRFLERNGLKAGIISQPKWKEPENFLKLGIPNIAFAVSGGQMDSMVLNYTATKLPRKEDFFCEDKNPYFSKPGENKYRIRPDRCISVYCSQIRSVCKEKPIIIGGIEASLRRIAHYDYWSDKIKKSVLVDSKAQILLYGMGEYSLLRTLDALKRGISPENLQIENSVILKKENEIKDLLSNNDYVNLPSFEEIVNNKDSFSKAHTLFEENCDEKIVLQKQDTRYIVQYPAHIISQSELDAIYDIDFERKIHPSFKNVPAFDMIKNSVTSHRGCFGDCSFCALSMHQGKRVVSRSKTSVVNEIKKIASKKGFSGTITDIGGPSANMYATSCRIFGCSENNCLKDGKGCKNLISGTDAYLELLRSAGQIQGVKNIQINSGVRFDPCILDDKFLREILKNYISGQMKVAPESGSDFVLECMNKPKSEIFLEFIKRFERIKKEEKLKKYIIPYIIAGHPGEGDNEAKETENLLSKNHLSGRQFQIFTPTPMTRSTAMYYLGYDPYTKKKLAVEKDRKTLMRRKESMQY
ncbi:YgiQ family radical SAM protein [Methanomicrobium antiquum]|uniref:YgiQ family radical SAM protein n=1 Tax=Methanomicrobium antiquum TaxID=487686 RepID=A0AAF0JNQ1_9EURY|nr:YgiQ family radical SAM protein [Methanomicrobium antiquum]WFN37840.1 YgiQ family radical SAM protein [Methanomicrobium antiquum]